MSDFWLGFLVGMAFLPTAFMLAAFAWGIATNGGKR